MSTLKRSQIENLNISHAVKEVLLKDFDDVRVFIEHIGMNGENVEEKGYLLDTLISQNFEPEILDEVIDEEVSGEDIGTDTKEEVSSLMKLYSADDELKAFVTKFSVFILSFCFIYLLLGTFVPPEYINKDVLPTTTEFVKTAITYVLAFWLGSSVGSKLKKG